MSPKPHIFFATIASGGGHVATAKAMAQGLETYFPGRFQTTISDYMLELGLLDQDARHKAGWAWMLSHPWSARYGQRLLDTFPTLTNHGHRLMLDTFAQRAAVHLRTLDPALVVANHAWVSIALTRAQQRYGLTLPVLTFMTEVLDASALWAEPDAERVAVPSAEALRDLGRLGVSRSKIDLVGYPVQAAYLSTPPQAAVRRELGLAERLTCLVSLGREGVGQHTERVVETLLSHPLRPQVVVLTGHNRELKAQLDKRGDVFALPFTERVADYLAACDLVVGKAGPASVAEALAVGRAVLVSSYAGLNEAKLVRFLEDKTLGAHVPTPARLTQKLTEFAAPSAREQVSERSRTLQFSVMNRDLSCYLAEAATHGFPRTPLRSRGFG